MPARFLAYKKQLARLERKKEKAARICSIGSDSRRAAQCIDKLQLKSSFLILSFERPSSRFYDGLAKTF
jgi:hypothetical protein